MRRFGLTVVMSIIECPPKATTKTQEEEEDGDEGAREGDQEGNQGEGLLA